MKIYKIDLEEHIFVVIADLEEEAKDFVKECSDEEINIVEINSKELKKGVVLSYDYEDFYWE